MRDGVNQRIEQVVREEWPRLVATLVGDLGDLALAEDVAQDAAEVALERWIDDGIPDRPGAWITTVARRRALDRIRRERVGREKTETLARLESRQAEQPPGRTEAVLRDDQLALIFGCCHPALSVEAQVALTLRSVGGLTTGEIASGFLIAESTMAQRIVRAKRKIASATIPFRIPDDSEMLQRVGAVHHVLYLIFNEGYVSADHDALDRPDLAVEAIRLSRVLASLLNDDAETLGQLALFLLSHARREARVDAAGDVVLLEDQDRNAWDGALIDEGRTFLDHALALERPGPFQIEAAINALHAEAATAADTDWRQIALLYRRLRSHRSTPVVVLNQAVAVAMADGPEAGLAMIDAEELAEPLAEYRYFHATRADLLRRSGRADEAAGAYRRAIGLADNQAEIRFLHRRLAEVSD